MKTFFFILNFTAVKHGHRVRNSVYQIKNNKPVLVGETVYNTGSYRGHDHEAMNVIVEKKLLPSTFLRQGYINHSKSEKYKLIELAKYGR